MNDERIQRELTWLREGEQVAEFIATNSPLVLYRRVPADGARFGLPAVTDVVVPVPAGYPANPIDLAGLPVDSPFFQHVKGGTNAQGVVEGDGRQWRLVSYHPHGGGGGPPWDQTRHGFHTYFDHLVAWLYLLN